jgi:hypothetical protein
MNQQFDTTLRQSGVVHTFAVYSGGHSDALWRGHAEQWQGMALNHLAAGRRSHPAVTRARASPTTTTGRSGF